MTELQQAKELKEKIRYLRESNNKLKEHINGKGEGFAYYPGMIELSKNFLKLGKRFLELDLQQAKANLEGLGCGKAFNLCDLDSFNCIIGICGEQNNLCQDCQQAKEIYEEILA